MSKYIAVKLKKGKDSFEILCKPATVEPYREARLGIDKCLVVDEVFKNSQKLIKYKESELKQAFGTDDKMEIIKTILSEGTFPLTKDEVNKKITEKRGQTIQYIKKYYHDPRGEVVMPHPETRITGALDTMRYKFDPYETVENQVKEIMKTFPTILPVKPIDPPHVVREAIARDSWAQASKNKDIRQKGKTGAAKDRKSGKKNRHDD